VHRDLKPDNIFICHNDDEEVAKVLDFGIAKSSGAFGVPTGSATRTGAILGTPYYMSPEQAEGTKSVDHRTDVWALGVIAYECLVGQRPFESEALGGLLLAICTRPLPVPSHVADVPPGFDAWFAKACARELPERFQSAREAASELRQICGNAGTTTGGLGRSALNEARPSTLGSVAGTSQTNAYAASVGIDTQKRKGPALVALLIGVAFLVVAVAGATAFMLRSAPVASAGNAVPNVATPAAAAPAAIAQSPTVTPMEPASAPSASAAVATAKPPARAATTAMRPKPAKPAPTVDKKAIVERPVATTKPSPVAPPPTTPKPAVTAKPAVNLGI
jgi:serine/threonine-protein kinase